jgi:hypothetical protein
VGRKLAELAEADATVGAKFKAAKPNKGRRPHRPGHEGREREALAAVAAGLKGGDGSLAYSARLLHGRLDAAWNA